MVPAFALWLDVTPDLIRGPAAFSRRLSKEEAGPRVKPGVTIGCDVGMGRALSSHPSSFPRTRESRKQRRALAAWIPASAGMTSLEGAD